MNLGGMGWNIYHPLPYFFLSFSSLLPIWEEWDGTKSLTFYKIIKLLFYPYPIYSRSMRLMTQKTKCSSCMTWRSPSQFLCSSLHDPLHSNQGNYSPSSYVIHNHHCLISLVQLFFLYLLVGTKERVRLQNYTEFENSSIVVCCMCHNFGIHVVVGKFNWTAFVMFGEFTLRKFSVQLPIFRHIKACTGWSLIFSDGF